VTFSSTSEKIVLGKDNDEFTLKGKLDTSEIHYRHMVALQPISVSITNLFYNVTFDNNLLIVAEKRVIHPFNTQNLTEPSQTIAHMRLLEFPVGHYTGNSLVRTLNDLLNYEDSSSNNQIFSYSTTTGCISFNSTTTLKNNVTFSFLHSLQSKPSMTQIVNLDDNTSWTSTIWDTLGLDSRNHTTFNPFLSPDRTPIVQTWTPPKIEEIPHNSPLGFYHPQKSGLIENFTFIGPLAVIDVSGKTIADVEVLYINDSHATPNTQLQIVVGSYLKVTNANYVPEDTWIGSEKVEDDPTVLGYTWQILAYSQHFDAVATQNVTTRKMAFYF
jgi:hypothetical protein